MTMTMTIAISAIRAGARRSTRTLASTIQLPSSLTGARRFGSSSSSSARAASTARPPLLKLEDASLRTLSSSPSLNWTIQDAGADECWAIIAPASEAGGLLRRELIDILSGRSHPKKSSTNLQHGPTHPFVPPSSSPSRAIKHVSFATKLGSSSSSGEFTNYSARYGAIRDQDRITLYERFMDLLDCPVGLVAAEKLVPDPFAQHKDVTGLFKYRSDAEARSALEKAQKADKVIKDLAPLLMINDELLHRPVIALSNGQTRRARILSSLITGAELVVLEEPFSGIDVGTREKLNTLFAELHAGRRPRLVLVLREQDAIPDLVTHILRVNDQGKITTLGPRNSSSNNRTQETLTGSQLIQSNADASIGLGDTSVRPIISLNSVSIVYGDKTVLDRVSLDLHPCSRLILAGDNGSGKTTLLALLLGDHPKSFSLPASSLSLFSHARDHPSNARLLLNRRLGHLSPELFNAFPRKTLDKGGLTVGEVVASGFENVFARRRYTDAQKQRVYSLLGLFSDLIKPPQGALQPLGQEEDVRTISDKGFTELSNGSQAVVLFLRAVVGNPQLLVLDEPFQGMDKRQVERVRQFIDRPERFPIGQTEEQVKADLQERKRMAMVLVSHYESEWPTTFGSLMRLRDGVVVEHI